MKRIPVWSLIALLLPIVVLIGLTLFEHDRLQGQEVVLPIRGFDPRDLLAGHYLAYDVQYGVAVCQAPAAELPATQDVFICVEPRQFLTIRPGVGRCPLFIKGRCEHGRFLAGIEKFYLPQEDAELLERILVGDSGEDGGVGQGTVVLAVKADGRAVVKDLRVNGRSWREVVDP